MGVCEEMEAMRRTISWEITLSHCHSTHSDALRAPTPCCFFLICPSVTNTPGTENAKMSKAHSDTEGPTWSQELGLKVEQESGTGGGGECRTKRRGWAELRAEEGTITETGGRLTGAWLLFKIACDSKVTFVDMVDN